MVVSTTLALVGCLEFTVGLRLSDIRAVATGEEVLHTTAAFKVPLESIEECSDVTSELVELMEDIVDNIRPEGCEEGHLFPFEDDPVTILFASTEIPLVNSVVEWQKHNTLFGVVVIPQSNESESASLAINIVRNLSKLNLLNERSDIVERMIVSLVIENDNKLDSKLLVENAYFQEGYETTGTISVHEDGKVEFYLGDDSLEQLFSTGSTIGFTLISED